MNIILTVLSVINFSFSFLNLINFFLEMEIYLLLVELEDLNVSDNFKQILVIYYQDLETNHVEHRVHKKY